VSRSSIARRCTYLLEPKNWVIVTVVAVGWHADGVAGLGWGLLAALFAAVFPTMFITRGIARGSWADRNVGARGPRLVVLSFIIASVTLGLVLLAVFGAPRELTWYFGCMLVSVAVLAAITTVWKISIHCAVASGSVTILSLLFGPWVTPAYALVALTAWSRVALKDHTITQVLTGAVLGAAAAAITYRIIPKG
jgi:membrane-associated phospholipid phosphatase